MKNVILLLLGLCIFSACSKDSDEDLIEQKDDKIWVEAYYTTKEKPNKEIEDFKSPVFVYYNIDADDFYKYTYLKDGVFVYDADTIKPMYSDTIDVSGRAIIEPEVKDKIVTVGIASNFYEGRISLSSFDMNYARKKIIKQINNP